MDEYKEIPGYPGYEVSKNGIVRETLTKKIVNYCLPNGYKYFTPNGATKTLSFHRAVALAWVYNDDPDYYEVVNHIDGNKLNNCADNLEWTDYSGNNYHAINNGLRSDNIPCRVRDAETGLVTNFNSMAQASVFMGHLPCTPYAILRPKKFGALISKRFEFRYDLDQTPWFYETRPNIGPENYGRYMVIVIEPDGRSWEIFGTKNLLKTFQLYKSKSQAIPELIKEAEKLYPDKKFVVRDSYTEQQIKISGINSRGYWNKTVYANKDTEVHKFNSLTKCANWFGVDRSVINSRLDTGKEFGGWTFTTKQRPSRPETVDENLFELLETP